MNKIYSILSAIIIAVCLASCQSDEAVKEIGYLSLDIKTLVSTNTRATDAPAGYKPKQIYVEIVNSNGEVVKSTADFENDAEWKGVNIKLEPGTYTINAHSNNWDGSQSGFDTPYYFGTAKATIEAKTRKSADITCTLANVKVTVNFDKSFSDNFTSAVASISSSLTGINPLTFTMGQTTASGYFPVSDLKSVIEVVNKFGEQHSQTDNITDVKARDHYIFNYKVADYGNAGSITITVDESTQTYTYDFQVAKKAANSVEATKAVAEDVKAVLKGKIGGKDDSFNNSNISLLWKKKGDADWTKVAASNLTIDSEDNITYSLTGLTEETTYVYYFEYKNEDDVVKSSEVEFTTKKSEPKEQIYNGGFESWYSNGNVAYANESGTSYWDSSNKGSANFGGSVTTQDIGFKHSGNSSARLETRVVNVAGIKKLAAGSIFTGKFIGLISTTGAKLDWGVPFTSRPSALKGFLSYAPAAINQGSQPTGVGAPKSGSNDQCQIFCILLTQQLKVGGNVSRDEYEKSTTIDWENDPRVIAYGSLTYDTNDNGQWHEFKIPLIYHDANAIPAYMVIVCSASKFGDYFYGGGGTVLNIDDFEFEYGERTLK